MTLNTHVSALLQLGTGYALTKFKLTGTVDDLKLGLFTLNSTFAAKTIIFQLRKPPCQTVDDLNPKLWDCCSLCINSRLVQVYGYCHQVIKFIIFQFTLQHNPKDKIKFIFQKVGPPLVRIVGCTDPFHKFYFRQLQKY